MEDNVSKPPSDVNPSASSSPEGGTGDPANPSPTPPETQPVTPTSPNSTPDMEKHDIHLGGVNGKKASKFSIKAIIGTIIFLLLAGVAAAGYVYREPLMAIVTKPTPTPTVSNSPTPTPDPTANWKTYQNAKYKFSINYPDSLEVKETTSPSFYVRIIDSSKTFRGEGGSLDNPYFHITFISYEGTLDNYILDPKSNMKVIEKKILNGKVFVKFEEVQGMGHTFTRYAFKNGDYIALAGDYLMNNDILFDQILSTFKFTDSAAVDTSKWKTYNDPEGIYNFKYPSDLTTSSKLHPTYNQQVTALSKNLNDPSGKCTSINILTFDKNESDMKKWIEQNLKRTQSGTSIVIPVAYKPYTNLYNKSILGFWTESGSESIAKNISLNFNNKFVLFSYGACGDTGDKYIYHTDDEKLLEQIITTFKFTVYSAEKPSKIGENCGPNAGAGGDAVCENGLSCKYNTQEALSNKIGVCEK